MPTELKSACARIIVSAKGRRPFPDVAAITAVAAKFEGLAYDHPKSAIDLDASARGIRASIGAGEPLTRKQLREAPWCLWTTDPALADDGAVLAKLIEAWTDWGKPRLFRSLASAFIDSYGAEQSSREAVSTHLSALAGKSYGAWSDLHRKFSIFDLRQGPRMMAREVISSGRSPVDIFRSEGLGDVAAHGGLTELVVAELLVDLANDPDHERRLDLVTRFAIKRDGRIEFAGQGPGVVDALLRPLVGKTAEISLQDRFLAVLVKAFGDPRLKPGNWASLPHKELVLAWLTRQSLRQFLDVVDATTVDYDAKRMWKYRRAFWEGAYEFYRSKNIPVAAWVAFGPAAEHQAKRMSKDAAFATLYARGRQVSSDHAVLLFQIADCVVADWNHNGRCNIWSDPDVRGAPKLFDMSYGSDSVRIAVPGNIETPDLFCISHTVPDTYSWQDRVAQRLFELTGIRLPRSAYRLK